MNISTSHSVVDLRFSLHADIQLPADHAWPLFGAVSRVVPAVHGDGDTSGGFGIFPIAGVQAGGRSVAMTTRSRLIIRTPVDRISELLPLAGATLDIGGVTIRPGAPEIQALVPADSLRARMITIKLRETPVTESGFRAAVRRQLDQLEVRPDVRIELPARSTWSGEERTAQRTVHVKGRDIIGFEVRLHGLSSDESLVLQQAGLGGRRALGCGLFVPFQKSVEATIQRSSEGVNA